MLDETSLRDFAVSEKRHQRASSNACENWSVPRSKLIDVELRRVLRLLSCCMPRTRRVRRRRPPRSPRRRALRRCAQTRRRGEVRRRFKRAGRNLSRRRRSCVLVRRERSWRRLRSVRFLAPGDPADARHRETLEACESALVVQRGGTGFGGAKRGGIGSGGLAMLSDEKAFSVGSKLAHCCSLRSLEPEIVLSEVISFESRCQERTAP